MPKCREILWSMCVAMTLLPLSGTVRSDDPSRVFPADAAIPDARLAPLRNTYDKLHQWSPPATKAEWEVTRESIRRRILVACGLWPLPEKQPMNPVIHGKVDRGDYTVERVYFASRPGHYVTGNLYRPKTRGDAAAKKMPGVLCPHGHWPNGRFYDAGEGAASQLESGAESYLSGARYPVQARMVQLARMGCVVFHYDMVGYADSTSVDHRSGYNDAEAELWLSNKLGLQTWNSIRALDFLASLPDVDPGRLGVTGASGGGTQTFLLCAIDDRPAVAFPAVMVSTAMQGGCVCENASYLRIGINNVALAAAFAPKPMALSGADDWTIDIESRGLPELRRIYSMYGVPGDVSAQCYPQFKHNYNEVSRRLMYGWFKQHLKLDSHVSIEQTDFWPLTQEESTVFTKEQPLPDDSLTAEELREQDRSQAIATTNGLMPRDAPSLATYREIVGGAARIMLTDQLPMEGDVEFLETGVFKGAGFTGRRGWVSRIVEHQRVPVVDLRPASGEWRQTVVWFDGEGKGALFGEGGEPIAAVARLLEGGSRVVSADLFLTGEFLNDPKLATRVVDEKFPGFTYCFNRPLVSERVRDICLVIAIAHVENGAKPVQWVGTGEAGRWVVLARAVAALKERGESSASTGNAPGLSEGRDRTIADMQEFRFESVHESQDSMLLPGALRYGGVPGFLRLAADGEIELYGCGGEIAASMASLSQEFEVLGGKLSVSPVRLTPDGVADRLSVAK